MPGLANFGAHVIIVNQVIELAVFDDASGNVAILVSNMSFSSLLQGQSFGGLFSRQRCVAETDVEQRHSVEMAAEMRQVLALRHPILPSHDFVCMC